jgi:hypothetical protein
MSRSGMKWHHCDYIVMFLFLLGGFPEVVVVMFRIKPSILNIKASALPLSYIPTSK